MKAQNFVLTESAYFPANQYNTGAYVRFTYYNPATGEYIADAVRLGDIIASGSGTSAFRAQNAMQTVLLEQRDGAPKAA